MEQLATGSLCMHIAEALGMALPHSALAPSGEPVWIDMARRSAMALMNLAAQQIPLSAILTRKAIENALVVHAAFGGSTNLLLHVPAIAHAASTSTEGPTPTTRPSVIPARMRLAM